jgi:hypothetical protein
MELDAIKIHHEQDAILGSDASPYSTVMCTLRPAIWIQTDSETSHIEIDDINFQALGEIPFAPMKKFARRLCCAPTTLYHPLTALIHVVSNHSYSVPHHLAIPQKVLRVEKLREFLPFIKSVRHNVSTLFITLDECRLYLHQDFERQWLPATNSPLVGSEA